MRQVSYNADNVVFTVDGHRVRDYGEDMISIEYREDRVEMTVGALGDYITSISNDKSAEITLTLLQNSLSLEFLRDLQESGKSFPASLVDMNDNIIESAQDVWVQDLGEYSRGKEAEEVEVTLVAGRWE